MSLVYRGTVDAKKAGTYQNRKYAVLQFIERDDRGAIKLVEINLPDEADHTQFTEGSDVEIPVRVTANGGKIFYRAIAEAMATPAALARR